MILERVDLHDYRVPKFTYLSALVATTINADPRRRGLRLQVQDPNLANTSSWTGNVKRPITLGGPVINVVVMSVNQGVPTAYIDIDTHGLLVQEAFTFAGNIGGGDAAVWEFFYQN